MENHSATTLGWASEQDMINNWLVNKINIKVGTVITFFKRSEIYIVYEVLFKIPKLDRLTVKDFHATRVFIRNSTHCLQQDKQRSGKPSGKYN